MTTKIGSNTSGITFEFDNGYAYTLTTNKTAAKHFNNCTTSETYAKLTVQCNSKQCNNTRCNSKQCTGTNCNQVKCTNTQCTGTKCGTVQCSVYRQCQYYYYCNDCSSSDCPD